MNSRLLIGVLSYNDLPFLRETLPLARELMERCSARVVVLDTAWNDEIQNFLKTEFPEFVYLRDPSGNIGYGRSYNAILKANPGFDFFMVLTSDVLIHVPTVERFLHRMEKDSELTMCAGKLHWWDFAHGQRTEKIDSLGIYAEKRHHFYDLGHGELDRGQYDARMGKALGISGAVFLICISAVERIHGKPGQIFDERFWMYKEDIDLAYRLRWLKEKVVIFPEVWGWHARTVANKEGHALRALVRSDRDKRAYARYHSYANHFVLLKNNFSFSYGLGVFFQVVLYELLKASVVLFRSPKAFFFGLRTLLFVPGQSSSRRASPQEMLRFFH